MSMSKNSINRALTTLANSILNEGLYLRHDSEKALVPFMFLKTITTETEKTLALDEDPLELAQILINNDRKVYTHVIIVHEAPLNDENGNRVDAIIVNAFDLSLKKGIQLAQKFNPKTTGEFRKIGTVEILKTPDLIFKLQKSADNIDLQKKPHFSTEIKTDNDGLDSIYTELSHHNPTIISDAISNFIIKKLSENERYDGVFEIDILEDAPIKNIGLLRFLCSNAIHEVLGSKTSNNWMQKTKRKLMITCTYNNAVLYQEKSSINNSTDFKLDDDNYPDLNIKQLDLEFKSVLLDAKKNSKYQVDYETF